METPTRAAPKGAAIGWLFAANGVLVAAGFVSLAGRPEVASVHGETVDSVLDFLFVVVGAFLLVGHFLLGWWILKYRGNQGAADYVPATRKTEIRVAIAVVAVMLLVSESGVIILGLPAWEQLYGETPAGSLEVDVVGKQFGWLVRYPGKDGRFGKTNPELVNDMDNPMGLDQDDESAADDIVLDGVMHLPVDRPVVARLRSHDVLHSFSVAPLRIKQDLVPGMTTKVQFRPTKAGKYEIACAELCGLGHYRMRGVLTVEAAGDFDRWLQGQETFN